MLRIVPGSDPHSLSSPAEPAVAAPPGYSCCLDSDVVSYIIGKLGFQLQPFFVGFGMEELKLLRKISVFSGDRRLSDVPVGVGQIVGCPKWSNGIQ